MLQLFALHVVLLDAIWCVTAFYEQLCNTPRVCVAMSGSQNNRL